MIFWLISHAIIVKDVKKARKVYINFQKAPLLLNVHHDILLYKIHQSVNFVTLDKEEERHFAIQVVHLNWQTKLEYHHRNSLFSNHCHIFSWLLSSLNWTHFPLKQTFKKVSYHLQGSYLNVNIGNGDTSASINVQPKT